MFITPNSFNYLDPSTLYGLDLHTYCMFNPVMYVDSEGNIAFLLLTAGIGLLAGLGIATYLDYKEDEKWFNGNVWSYVVWALGGAAIGALLGATAAATLAGNFSASFGQIITGAKALIALK